MPSRNFSHFDEQTIEAPAAKSKIFWPVQNFNQQKQLLAKNSGQNTTKTAAASGADFSGEIV